LGKEISITFLFFVVWSLQAGEALTVTDPNEAWVFHVLSDDTTKVRVSGRQRGRKARRNTHNQCQQRVAVGRRWPLRKHLCRTLPSSIYWSPCSPLVVKRLIADTIAFLAFTLSYCTIDFHERARHLDRMRIFPIMLLTPCLSCLAPSSCLFPNHEERHLGSATSSG